MMWCAVHHHIFYEFPNTNRSLLQEPVLAGLGIESKFRPEDASKLKSGMKSACTIRNRERWKVDGKEERWMIERDGDLR